MSRSAADLFDPTPKPADAFETFLTGCGVPRSPWIGYLAAIGFVFVALAARFAMLPVSGGLAFNTFYPAVILTAMLFGIGPGLLAGALGAVCALYFFMPPYFSFDDLQAHFVPRRSSRQRSRSHAIWLTGSTAPRRRRAPVGC
jgi:predicted lysophospholipase L1 biosynthesis ABC-type transport system permease subunit